METRIACSACRAVFAAGAVTCPRCGLQLTAQALPVVEPQPRPFPLWAIVAIGIAVGWAAVAINNSFVARRQADLQSAFLADLKAGKLATPEAFEARCGEPAATTQTPAGPELHYYKSGDYYVRFVNGQPVLEDGHIDWSGAKPREWRSGADDSFYFSALECK